MKTQKTLVIDMNAMGRLLKEGDEVILYERKQEGADISSFHVIKHLGEGISGNANKEIKKYHGWRGTRDGIATYAHGVRKILKVGKLPLKDAVDLGMYDPYKITVSEDIHPEWD